MCHCCCACGVCSVERVVYGMVVIGCCLLDVLIYYYGYLLCIWSFSSHGVLHFFGIPSVDGICVC